MRGEIIGNCIMKSVIRIIGFLTSDGMTDFAGNILKLGCPCRSVLGDQIGSAKS